MNICILGTTGSGKTTAAQVIARYVGAEVVESDDLSHEAYAKGTDAYDRLLKRFGSDILSPDGSINRSALGDIVFDQEKEREFLREAVDSIVRDSVHRHFVNANRGATGGVHKVLASYLMVERKWHPELFQHALVITAAPRTCVQRLSLSRGWSERKAEKVLGVQKSAKEVEDAARKLFGTRVTVVQNDGDIAQLEQEIRRFLDSLLSTTDQEGQKLWAQFLENESTHLLSIFIAEEQRASWFLALAGALFAVVVATKPPSPVALLSLFSAAVVCLCLAVIFSLAAVYPVQGYRRIYSDLWGTEYRSTRKMSLEAFLVKHARPGTWSMADYMLRVQYHYRSHWMIAFRRKRMTAWATILTLLASLLSALHVLNQILLSR
jgi:dephospho-CoA kinase